MPYMHPRWASWSSQLGTSLMLGIVLLSKATLARSKIKAEHSSAASLRPPITCTRSNKLTQPSPCQSKSISTHSTVDLVTLHPIPSANWSKAMRLLEYSLSTKGPNSRAHHVSMPRPHESQSERNASRRLQVHSEMRSTLIYGDLRW